MEKPLIKRQRNWLKNYSGDMMYDCLYPKAYWEDPNILNHLDKLLGGIKDMNLFLKEPSNSDNVDVKDKVVLDLGCGIGRIANRIIERGAKRYIGIDFSKPSIEVAKEIHKLDNCEFITNDGMTIPLPDESIDIVVSDHVFLHVPKDVTLSYLNEIKRVLKPDGLFVGHIAQSSMYQGGLSLEDIKNAFEDYDISHYTKAGEFYYNVTIKR